MWKKKHITFLTQNHIDKDRIITVLEQYTSNSKDDQDKKILTGILKNFKNNDLRWNHYIEWKEHLLLLFR